MLELICDGDLEIKIVTSYKGFKPNYSVSKN